MSLITIGLSSLGEDLAMFFNTFGFFKRLRSLHDRDSHGGYWCLADRLTGAAIRMGGIGTVHEDKLPKYIEFACFEKPRRLASHPEHLSSFQSRDPESGKWGGAIRSQDYILSFSGLPELMDEALMLVVATRIRLITEEQAKLIASISQNEFFAKALALYDECTFDD